MTRRGLAILAALAAVVLLGWGLGQILSQPAGRWTLPAGPLAFLAALASILAGQWLGWLSARRFVRTYEALEAGVDWVSGTALAATAIAAGTVAILQYAW